MKQKTFASIRGKTLVIFHDFSYICLEFLGDVGVDLGCCLCICMADTIHNSFQRNSIFCQATDQGVAEDVTGQIFLDWFLKSFVGFLECQIERVGLDWNTVLSCEDIAYIPTEQDFYCINSPLLKLADGESEDFFVI